VELEDTTAATAYTAPPEQLEHDVLRLHPRLQSATELDPDDARPLDDIWPARHHDRYLRRARSDREHPEPTRHRRVGVGPDEDAPRSSEPLEVQVMRDPVPGS
jgi:hypothetical protein